MANDSKQYKDSSSVDNMQAIGQKAKRAAAFLRETKLGNAAFGGRPFGK